MKLKSRKKYFQKWKAKAKKVNILFIAESPPHVKEGEEPKYFYFDDDTEIESNSLSYHLFRALKIDTSDREKALKDFISKKYFLIDAIEKPIFQNGKLKSKKKQIYKNVERIKQEINEFNPKQIIVIGKTVYKNLSKFLDKKLDFVYFPSYQWVNKFKDGIKEKV